MGSVKGAKKTWPPDPAQCPSDPAQLQQVLKARLVGTALQLGLLHCIILCSTSRTEAASAHPTETAAAPHGKLGRELLQQHILKLQLEPTNHGTMGVR